MYPREATNGRHCFDSRQEKKLDYVLEDVLAFIDIWFSAVSHCRSLPSFLDALPIEQMLKFFIFYRSFVAASRQATTWTAIECSLKELMITNGFINDEPTHDCNFRRITMLLKEYCSNNAPKSMARLISFSTITESVSIVTSQQAASSSSVGSVIE